VGSALIPDQKARPELSVHVSPHLLELLQEGAVEVDYLKVGPWLGRENVHTLDNHRPLLFHSDLILSSSPPLSPATLAETQAWLALTGTPWLSAHIGFSCEAVVFAQTFVPAPGTRPLSRDEARANIVRNARQLAAAIPVPLLLENIPRFFNRAHDHVTEPDFVAQVIAETGCDLLLDLAHAQVSAAALGHTVSDYLARLPLARTVEIHVSGPRPLDGVLTDCHEPLQEEDYRLLAWVLERTQPRLITLEYAKDKAALAEQIGRLRQMIADCRLAISDWQPYNRQSKTQTEAATCCQKSAVRASPVR
jgi:uncharacterized protein (UPF0276 family)